ncbi:MAG: D-aminoacyl-tRNA deacylase [Chlamydiae bacterium]|nr:D-aminoacyl-tRNA deacylase [Chlamydiota bacterium]
MRLLVQRVKEASVEVDGEIVGAIGSGLLAFLGLHQSDNVNQIPWMVKKLCGLRIFRDENDKMNLSVQDVEGEILVVSQFTLYGDCSSGRRPSFVNALSGSEAEKLYDQFIKEVQETMGKVQTGKFGASMQVSLVNDGPVTLLVDV